MLLGSRFRGTMNWSWREFERRRELVFVLAIAQPSSTTFSGDWAKFPPAAATTAVATRKAACYKSSSVVERPKLSRREARASARLWKARTGR